MSLVFRPSPSPLFFFFFCFFFHFLFRLISFVVHLHSALPRVLHLSHSIFSPSLARLSPSRSPALSPLPFWTPHRGRFSLDLLAHLALVSPRIGALTAPLSPGQSFVATAKCNRYKSALNAMYKVRCRVLEPFAGATMTESQLTIRILVPVTRSHFVTDYVCTRSLSRQQVASHVPTVPK